MPMTAVVSPRPLHLQIPQHLSCWFRFARRGFPGSQRVDVRVLYHLVSLPLPLDLGRVNVVSILGKMRRLVST